jgi:hypothetical protein
VVSNLNPQQFTSFRGIMLGKGAPPEDDSEIVAALDPRVKRNNGLSSAIGPYGPHWTDDEGTARRFARDTNAGGYERVPAIQRKLANTPGKPWGVVLEAHHNPSPVERELQARFNDPNYRQYHSVPYSEHENEVRVWRPEISSVTAHVVEGFRGQTTRSFDLPAGHWDPSPDFHQRAVDKWLKERQKDIQARRKA